MLTRSSKIYVTSKSFSQDTALKAELCKYFTHVTFNEKGQEYTEDELVTFLKTADAAIVGLEKMTESVFAKLPNLKIVSKYGVGLDNIDLNGAEKLKRQIAWTGGVNKRAVSELTLMFMLLLARKSFEQSIDVKKSIWKKITGSQLTGRTVGIVGCGHIGEDLLSLLQPFKCEILIHDILDKSEIARKWNAKQVSFSELAKRSDFVTFHVPLTEKTNRMINSDFLASLKPGAFIINTCRGGIVDENALLASLKQSKLGGVALDVLTVEPPKEYDLFQFHNVIGTPHIGGSTRESISAMGQAAIDGLKKWIKE